jgi:hypothetical protein
MASLGGVLGETVLTGVAVGAHEVALGVPGVAVGVPVVAVGVPGLAVGNPEDPHEGPLQVHIPGSKASQVISGQPGKSMQGNHSHWYCMSWLGQSASGAKGFAICPGTYEPHKASGHVCVRLARVSVTTMCP